MSISKSYFFNSKALFIKLSILITLSTLVLSPSWAGYKNIVRLKSISGNYSDETIIRLHPQATYNFDSNWDAYKLSNGGNTPNFYSILNSINYSINSIPDTLTDCTIPFKMVGAFTGNYSIVITGIDSINFDPNFSVVLEDRSKSLFMDLWTIKNYDFTSIAKDTSTRFYLHIKSKSLSSTPTTTSSSSSSTNTADTTTATTINTPTDTTSSTNTSNQNSTSDTTTNTNNNTPLDPSLSSGDEALTTSVIYKNTDELINFYQAANRLELTFNQSVGNTTFYCYNSTGEQILKSSTITNCYGHITLDIPDFVKPGYYTLAILTDKELHYKKFLISK